MACSISLFGLLTGSPDTGGTWAETTPAAPTYTGQGGTITGGHVGTIDATGITPKTYTFQYTVGACTDTSIVTVTVVAGANAGTNFTGGLCNSSTTLTNLYGLLGAGVATNGVWSGNLITSAGYSNNGTAALPTDDTFNPSLVPAGTYTAIYTVNNGNASTPVGCTNCVDTATITITVTAAANAGIDASVTLCN